MPNDAKLGMIVGMGLVIAIAVLFFRKEIPPGEPAPEQVSVRAATPARRVSVPISGSIPRTVQAHTAIRTDTTVVGGRRHTVTAGETLFTLARRYYRDERKFVDIYRVNQEVLPTPDALTPGTVLIIPKAP